MSENCNHDCASCGSDCKDRTAIKKETQNELSNVKKIYAVVSGKGGVGKSFVSSALATAFSVKGFNTAIIDADITGPSIPKAYGITQKTYSPDGKFLTPALSRGGIKIMSVNLLLENESDPVVWRGPMIAGVVKQFFTDVIWGEVDYMFVDLPPGTGDVPLTVFQSLPINGIIVVTSPQDLVSVIVSKAVKMAKMMNIPLLGIVENYSYCICSHCGEKMHVFGESKVDATAKSVGVNTVCKLPLDPKFAKIIDCGNADDLIVPELNALINVL